MTQHDIQLIVLDVDRTLLNDAGVLSERNKQAIAAAQARGVRVMLATGKTFYSCAELVATLNLNTPSVFVQGLVTHNPDGSPRSEHVLDPMVIRRIVPYAESQGHVVVAVSRTRLLVKAADARVDFLTAQYGEPRAEAVGSLVNIAATLPINKLIVIGSDARAARAMRWQLDKQMDGKVNLVMTHVDHQVEVLPHGTNKGRAVAALAKELGIPAAKVLAIGDGDNDIEMIQFAGLGIAVGNATEGLKRVAQHVVASNNEDGVAEAIERFVLPPPAPAAETPADSQEAQ